MSDLTPKDDQFPKSSYPEDEIDLKALFLVLWRGKRLISAITGVAAVISVVIALLLPNIYTASALLAPAETSGGGLSGIMKQYGGLASLAGVSLPGGEEGSRAQLGMHLLKSRAFISDFVERRNILPELMAVDYWDEGSRQLIFDSELYDAASNEWVRETEASGAAAPSAQKAHKAFLSLLGVSEDKKTGYVTISINHQSPTVAAEWVKWLVEDVNAAVKTQDVMEAERSIEYLKQQVDKTSLADLQVMFFELIQSQTETVMLAEVRPEYVFKTIDPAVIPEVRSKPSRALICIIGTFIGCIFGIVTVLISQYARSNTKA
jgi:uncharacterized protein involved in exopolysaccharide biosynthesis